MKYEDLVGWKIVDVAQRVISEKKGLVLMKGDNLLLLQPKDNFDVYDLKLRKGEIQKLHNSETKPPHKLKENVRTR